MCFLKNTLTFCENCTRELGVRERGEKMGSSFKGMLGQALLLSQKCSTSDMKGPEELQLSMPDSSTNRGYLKGNPAALLHSDTETIICFLHNLY